MEGASKQLQTCAILIPVGLSNPLGGNCLSREEHFLVLASREWRELRDGLLSLPSLRVLGFLWVKDMAAQWIANDPGSTDQVWRDHLPASLGGLWAVGCWEDGTVGGKQRPS